jgi:hypothetical protein
MPRGKKTITRDSVFRSTDDVSQVPMQGMPDEAKNHQTAVWLGEPELEWLDNKCQELRRGGWRGVTRSALIRALIRASMDKQIDIRGVSGEEEFRFRVAI